MAVSNNIGVWGISPDEYGSTSLTLSSGNTPGFLPGGLIYAQEVNKAFRNATIVPYAIAEMLTAINTPSLNIAFDIAPASVPAFASTFKTVFNNYIISKAGKIRSAQNADVASHFYSSATIELTGAVVGSVESPFGWTISTKIPTSTIITSMISDNAITESKISAFAVTGGKIASGAITTDKIADGTIQHTDLDQGIIWENNISSFAITSGKIVNGAVTNEKLQNPYMIFRNGSLGAKTINLGSLANMYNLFGFNSLPSGIVKFNGSASEFFIEPDITGEDWKIIPNNYTSGNTFITETEFPYASTVGAYAFYGCSNLSSISLPNVEYIMSSAFTYCTNLQSELSFSKVKFIGTHAFYKCSNLTKVVLDYNGPITLGTEAFGGSNNLSLVLISNATEIYGLESGTFGYSNSIDLDMRNASIITGNFYSSGIQPYFRSVYIDNIEEIPSKFLQGQTKLVTLTNNASNYLSKCRKVGIYAFDNCNSITTIAFSSVLEEIGAYAFYGCNNLLTANLGGCKSIGHSAFARTNYLNTVIMSEVETIGPYAFENADALLSANLPNCTSIGSSAFYSTPVGQIYIPNCITIGPNAFAHCPNYFIIDAAKLENIGAGAFYNGGDIASINLPACQSIGSSAFYSNSRLRQINVGQCTRIEMSAFRDCTLLSSIWLGNENTICSIPNSYVFYGTKIYSGTGKIYVPTDIARNAYLIASGWSSLTNIATMLKVSRFNGF